MRIVSAAATAILLATPAGAAVLEVGPDKPFRQPSEAAARARDGDIVAIDPGEYYDCAIWHQNRLTIRATAPGVVITDRTCQDKALFVIDGSDVTINGLTFARARVPDRNGAGIRAEGGNLTLDDDTFLNNEVGVLAADAPTSELRIVGCAFIRNGVADPDMPARALRVGHRARLVIEASRFTETHGEEHILSAATRTELIANTIADGPDGTRLALVVVSDSDEVLLRDNSLRRGPNAARANAAVLVMDTRHVTAGGNQLANATSYPMALLLDWNNAHIDLDSNTLSPGDAAVSTNGRLRHQARTLLDDARHLAGTALRRVRSALR